MPVLGSPAVVDSAAPPDTALVRFLQWRLRYFWVLRITYRSDFDLKRLALFTDVSETDVHEGQPLRFVCAVTNLGGGPAARFSLLERE